MSSYRNYVSWKKENLPSNYTAETAKKETQPKYESSYSKNRPDTAKKNEEKFSSAISGSSNSGVRTRTYSDSSYNSAFQHQATRERETKNNDSSRLALKKESHPPVTYRPIGRSIAISSTTSRSRDPSPVERTRTDSTSNYDLNRLYPRPYTRSVSQETTDSVSSSTIIPKYNVRSATSKEDLTKYGALGRTSRNNSNEDISLAKYRPPERTPTKEEMLSSRFKLNKDSLKPKEEVIKIKSSISTNYSPKSDMDLKYKSKTVSSTILRDDLSIKTPQKYITSRFLPKNTVEKSLTAYRPSSVRSNDVSRKNRELLNTLSTFDDKSNSRSFSRCSSVTPGEDIPRDLREKLTFDTQTVEMETLTVITRSTSPNMLMNSSNIYTRCRRADVARLIEKQICRPKQRPEMVDQEVQLDRMDDCSKYSKYIGVGSASRIATSTHNWSNYLDLKYSSPNLKGSSKNHDNINQNDSLPQACDEQNPKKDIPCGISRTNSIKSVNSSTSSSNSKLKEKPKSKIPTEGKKLPPQIPKMIEQSPMKAMHSQSTPNKDFRKSVLNMSCSDIKHTKRSNSVSSAESDSSACGGNSEATEVSENLSSSVLSCPKISQSKLPQRVAASIADTRKSPSSESSSCTSSEDDSKSRKSKSPSKLKFFQQSIGGSRTSSADELSLDKTAPKPPLSPRLNSNQKGGESPTVEAKSFLMRALAPVTNFFKNKQDSIESKDRDIQEEYDTAKPRKLICRMESGEKAVWHVESNQPSKISQKLKTKLLRHAESGELAWWLDDKTEVPSDIITHPVTSVDEAGNQEDGRLVYKTKRTDSMEEEWWLDSPPTKAQPSNMKSEVQIIEDTSEFSPNYPLRHIDSGERAWWMSSSENLAQSMEKQAEEPSDSKNWWDTLTSNNSDFDYHGGIPLGDRASPEGLEMPLGDENEGRLSPYDNVINSRNQKYINIVDNKLFISKHTNIDDILGGSSQLLSPLMEAIFNFQLIDASQVKIHEADEGKLSYEDRSMATSNRLDDAALQVYKDGDYGSYLDLEASINEQQEEFDGFQSNASSRCSIGSSGSTASTSSTCSSGPSTSSSGSFEDPQDLSTHDEKQHQGVIDRHDVTKTIDLEYNIEGNNTTRECKSIAHRETELLMAITENCTLGPVCYFCSKKNSIVLRTQLSVRVHTIIEKLSTSEGRELRRALFSLKQIFQEDKDLVHEFVQNDGLACLIKVGSEADQNYQNYILRALGQVMLYVDGMNGVMENNQTIQWLYNLISSKFRLVVKTALKLLLVFVEYVDSNCMLLIKAINTVDSNQGLPLWYNIMRLLNDFDAADTELLIYATTLINKCLNGIPDQDTYYDQTDALEEQRIEATIQRYMSKPGTDLDLLQQFQIYEAVLQYEDGEDKTSSIRHLDESIRNTLRNRKSLSGSNGCSNINNTERRKSRRHSTGTTPVKNSNNLLLGNRRSTTTLPSGASLNGNGFEYNEDEEESTSSSFGEGYRNGRVGSVGVISGLGSGYKECSNAFDNGVTPALRRRRERAERQRCFMKEQESTTVLRTNSNTTNDLENEAQLYTNGLTARLNNSNNVLSTRTINNNNNNTISSTARKDLTPILNAVNRMDSSETEHLNGNSAKLLIMYNNNDDEQIQTNGDTINDNDNRDINDVETETDEQVFKIKRENTVKDLTQKLSGQVGALGDVEKLTRIGDMTGVISKAMEGLAKSKSQANVAKNGTDGVISPKLVEVKKSENELRWEELALNITRPLNLCDMDFTDLASEDEADVLTPAISTNGMPPPPPPLAPPPPPPAGVNGLNTPPPPPLRTCSSSIASLIPPPIPPVAPPLFGVNLQRPYSGQQLGGTRMVNGGGNVVTDSGGGKGKLQVKSKKTVKLFWKEVRDESTLMVNRQKGVGYIWDELAPVPIDTQKLEHLFESRAKDIINKKQQDNNKNKEIIVLDPKRSNAINIGMTKLPPPRTIKTAILKMDATIMNREGIEKLLTMLPTEEERTKIQEAQTSNSELPLGSAEQFLLTLASITELPARLRLWAFKLDFECAEREIAEPLMDLKQGFETLRVNKTFRGILSTLLSIGNFLNGNAVKGFQIEYLTKVPEVKDTVHKHSLLHHLCHIVMEKFPDATDLYSEIGAVTRASKVDFDELALNIQRLETDCKTSWDHLKLIAKHDGSTMKAKMSDFLSDCAERIILLNIIYRRIKNRFHRFLLWLGIPAHQVADTKANEFCRIVSEFALEYRTTRERVLQQLEKKANHRERNKTRGKMITESGKFSTKEDRRADTELRQLLATADLSPNSAPTDVDRAASGLSTWRRARRQDPTTPDGTQNGKGANGRLSSYLGALSNGHLTDADDEILESLVKTATKGTGSRTAPRERKRTRHADRKSLRRTLKNGLSEEEKKHISTYIKGY